MQFVSEFKCSTLIIFCQLFLNLDVHSYMFDACVPEFRCDMLLDFVPFLVQDDIYMHLGKSACASLHLSDIFPMLPLKQFQCLFD